MARTVILEVQLQRAEEKLWSWPAYQAFARVRHKVPCDVLVVAPKASVAAWARKPIRLGAGSTFRATVIGPTELGPALVKVASVELALLAAIAHGEEEPRLVLDTAARLVKELQGDRAALYLSVVLSTLSDPTREAVEQLMQTSHRVEFKSEFMRALVDRGRAEGEAKGRAEGEAKGRAEGEAKGKAEGVLQVLAARGIAVSEEQQARVLGCTDVAICDRWIRKAVTLTSAEELFAE